jgi:hypothetical protein
MQQSREGVASFTPTNRTCSWLVGCMCRSSWRTWHHQLEWVQDDLPLSSRTLRCYQAQEEGITGSEARIHDGERVYHSFHASFPLHSQWCGYRWEEAKVFPQWFGWWDSPMLCKPEASRTFRPWWTKLLCSRIEEEYCQASASRSIRRKRTPTLGLASTSILRLLYLSSALLLKVLNWCLNLLDKDLSPLSGRWFRAQISFRLQTMGIRMLKEPQPL